MGTCPQHLQGPAGCPLLPCLVYGYEQVSVLTMVIKSLLLIMCWAGSDCSHYVILTLSSSHFIDEET